MYNTDVVTKTLNIQWKLLLALNTHSGSPLSAQMLWPWVWAERARVARTRTHSSDCCDHPACAPGGSRGTIFFTHHRQTVLNTRFCPVPTTPPPNPKNGDLRVYLSATVTSNVRRGTTMVIQLIAMVMWVRRCSAMMSMERRKRTDQMM